MPDWGGGRDQGWFLLCCAEEDFVLRNNGWPSMLQSQGTIWVDGAELQRHFQKRKKSPLSGVVEVEGNFSYHDIVW